MSNIRRKKSRSGESSKKRILSDEQANMLELHFERDHKCDSDRKNGIAAELGLDPRQVEVWFQNRRVRWKSKRLEEEYAKLKTEHETTVAEKCALETEVLKLKERLSQAEKEKLEQSNRVSSSNIPSSSVSVVSAGLEWNQLDDSMLWVTDANGIDWPNFDM